MRNDVCDVWTVYGNWQVFTFLGLDAKDLEFIAIDSRTVCMKADGQTLPLHPFETSQIGPAIAVPLTREEMQQQLL